MSVTIQDIVLGEGARIALFAGPCVVENREMIFSTAEALRRAAERHGLSLVFKSSFAKANRTSGQSFVGIGREEALRILDDLRRQLTLPVMTDVHSVDDVAAAADAVDVLQIPAFLCRQTDLLQAAGRSGKAVNIKKGQFMAPEDMAHAAAKVADVGNLRILLTERGTTFGYHNLVVDMRSLVIMRRTGYPVILDATHSLQLPGGDTAHARSGGQPEFILPIARAGVAVGCDGLFVEVHPDPPHALSDAASQLPLARVDLLLEQVSRLDAMVKGW
jgi:2-dehydro-3-deoxyphosphooctonate aldolase (KDO 8-P synthase)